jgi:hypothetical protein
MFAERSKPFGKKLSPDQSYCVTSAKTDKFLSSHLDVILRCRLCFSDLCNYLTFQSPNLKILLTFQCHPSLPKIVFLNKNRTKFFSRFSINTTRHLTFFGNFLHQKFTISCWHDLNIFSVKVTSPIRQNFDVFEIWI